MKSLSLRKKTNEDKSWLGVDLDGTLAKYDSGNFRQNVIGDPIPKMLTRVKKWLAEGKTVKIMTARAADPESIPAIKEWLKKHGLEDLEITNKKDKDMIELWDDRAIQVVENTGERVDGKE